MKRFILYFSLVFASFGFAQNSIFQSPPSKNALIEYIIDFLKKNPKVTIHGIQAELPVAFAQAPNKEALFKSLAEAMKQISQETVISLQEQVSTGNRGRYYAQGEFYGGKFVSDIREVRLGHIAESASISGSPIYTIFTQMHLLNEMQFHKFAQAFVQAMKESQEDLVKINASLKILEINSRFEQLKEVAELDNIPPERVKRFQDGILRKVEETFDKEKAVWDYSSRMLLESMQRPIDRANLSASANALQSQRARVLTIVLMALEKNVFSAEQKKVAQETAVRFFGETGDKIEEAEFKKVFQAAQGSPEVQNLLKKISETAASKALSCKAL